MLLLYSIYQSCPKKKKKKILDMFWKVMESWSKKPVSGQSENKNISCIHSLVQY